MVTMIMPNSRVPRRTNGVYMHRFSSTENTDPNAAPATSASHTLRPALVTR